MKKTEIEKLLHEAVDYMSSIEHVDASISIRSGESYTIVESEIAAMCIALSTCGHMLNGNFTPKNSQQLANVLFALFADMVLKESNDTEQAS